MIEGRQLSAEEFARGQLAGWPTARSTDAEKNVRTAEGSVREMERKGTPQDMAQAATLTQDGPVRLTTRGEMLTGSSAGMESGGRLNPRFSGWLMGYPEEWCEAALNAAQHTPSRRKRKRE